MAYPPDELPVNRTDNTPMGSGVHAGDHNDANQAINDIVEVLGTDPVGPYSSIQGWLEAAVVVVNHGATAATARPAGVGSVIWIGSVEPDNSINGDIWVDTSS